MAGKGLTVNLYLKILAENLNLLHTNIKGADKPAHVSTFVANSLHSMIVNHLLHRLFLDHDIIYFF